MIDQNTFDRLMPIAYQWAKAQEEFVLERGVSLGQPYLADAQRVGVKDAERIKVLIVDRIPFPENADLAEAAQRSHIITTASRAITIGYAIIIRADSWGDRELMVHQFVHVAQCERSGGLEKYLQEYLWGRQACATFTCGAFEEEARGLAREICASASFQG